MVRKLKSLLPITDESFQSMEMNSQLVPFISKRSTKLPAERMKNRIQALCNSAKLVNIIG